MATPKGVRARIRALNCYKERIFSNFLMAKVSHKEKERTAGGFVRRTMNPNKRDI